MCEQREGKLTTECGIFTVRTPDFGEPRPFYLGMLGLKATIRSTGCSDGFVASYHMWGGRLYLQELTVLTEYEKLPEIRGSCLALVDGEPTYFALHLPLGYTGDLWLEPREELSVWTPIKLRTRISYRLSFCGGLLRETEKVVYNPIEHYEAVKCPRDKPIDELPFPDTSTPFDSQIVPLSDRERDRIKREYVLEYKRHTTKQPREYLPLR
jgi:hypothetical protein